MLPLLEDYFGLPYPFGKLDQIGVPDFEAGAMENAGAITFREVALLLDPATAPLAVQKRVAEVITHELAHQWFGNLVTMVWWDDLWLNEAFATWMAYKIVDRLAPDVAHLDGLRGGQGRGAARSTRSCRRTRSARDGDERRARRASRFDAITYEKGGAVLRMLEGFLGAESVPRRHPRSTCGATAGATRPPTICGARSAEASGSRSSSWPTAGSARPAIRLVSVALDGRTGSGCRSGASSPSRRAERPRPGWCRGAALRGAARGVHEQRAVLLERRKADGGAGGAGAVGGSIANADATGFYRVGVSTRAARRGFGNSLGAAAPAERIGLLADQWALVRAGQAPIADFLDLALAFGDETDHAVLDELVGRLGYVEAPAGGRRGPGAVPPAGGATASGRRLQDLGWEPVAGESDQVRLRRAALLRAVAAWRVHASALAETAPRVDRVLNGQRTALDPNLLDTAVAVTARDGDAELFDRLRAAFPREADPAVKRRYLLALTAFEGAELREAFRGHAPRPGGATSGLRLVRARAAGQPGHA